MSQGEGAEAELPLESVGVSLMRAREAQGMSRSQLAAVTRIPERHLAAIEAGDFAALPARTYALGFSRSCAKALGLDEAAIAAEVRQELAAQDHEPARRGIPAFEPGDPARVPSGRLTWLAALGIVAVIVAGLLMWRSLYAPGGALPTILPDATPTPQAAAGPAAAAPAGPVVFTALEAGIWVKFYDGGGNQLLQKELAQGESWTVPADQPQVLLWTARPEALAITVGGQGVPKISEVQQMVKDVPVTATALLARGAAAASPEPAGDAARAAASPPPRRGQRSAPQTRRAAPQVRASEPPPALPAEAAPPPLQPAPAPAPTPNAT